jgi:alanine-alpha-ketoisovalerate/valine-pyruvate aminotransferase
MMNFSDFGKRFAGDIGIGELMDDLGDAMVSDPAPLMLGGGNPAHIPEVQNIFRQRMEAILSKSGEFRESELETMIRLRGPRHSSVHWLNYSGMSLVGILVLKILP